MGASEREQDQVHATARQDCAAKEQVNLGTGCTEIRNILEGNMIYTVFHLYI